MKRTLIFLLLVGGLLALIGGGGVSQQAGPLGIIVQPTELQVTVSVDKPVYYVGEWVTIRYSVNKPAYIYIINIDAAGMVRRIFPNAFSQDNYVDAGEYLLPDKPGYHFEVVPPTGTEYLQAIASTEPVNLPAQGSPEAFPLLGSDPSQVGAQIQGIIPVGAETATAWTSFQTVGGGPTNRPPVASFTFGPYYPLVGQRVVFDATSSYDSDGWISLYQWDFDSNGTTDAWGRRVARTFYTPGSHPVTLTVVDNLGASSSVTHAVWVQGYVPPAPAAGFYINIEPGNVLHITVQGGNTWFFGHQYRIELETDGSFTSIRHQISGGVAPLGIVPQPSPQSTLTLSGSVSTGKVDYYIRLSGDATKIKFKLLLDWDGDGALDQQIMDKIYIGPSMSHPRTNPFVLYFPSGTLSWAGAQICIALIDQPGFQFIVCFNFNP